MTMWSGRFEERMDPSAWQLNASIQFDRRLAIQDVRSSIAWAQALEDAGLLTAEEGERIRTGLHAVSQEFETQTFDYQNSDEDIHTAVERRLTDLIGPVAGKLHTGRSRNDQVATDFRLWLLDHLPHLEEAVANLQRVLTERAEQDAEILMPGYTHMQRAQPISLGHWWLSHFWPFQRDRERLAGLKDRTATLPLGSGALAGTPFPVDRAALASNLGFSRPSPNSLDAVADRDFAAEFAFCSALIGVHVSKFCEGVILFSSAEFGFFELSERFATGSSLMPQKKNPDVYELGRAKAGPLLGHLTGLMTTLKGLPSAYDKDLQEDKLPVFAAYDTLLAVLPVLAEATRALTVHPDRMLAAIQPDMLATDLADYLVARGVPFREAHAAAGQAVRLALEQGTALDRLEHAALQKIHAAFGPDVREVFDPVASVARRKATGGTAPEALSQQLQHAKALVS